MRKKDFEESVDEVETYIKNLDVAIVGEVLKGYLLDNVRDVLDCLDPKEISNDDHVMDHTAEAFGCYASGDCVQEMFDSILKRVPF